MSRKNSELDFNIPLTSELEEHDEKQPPENSNIDIMCAKIEQAQAKNLNLFTQNLANLLNMFLNRLEEANKYKSIPVTDAQTSNHSGVKAIVNNGYSHGFLSKTIVNNVDENNLKKVHQIPLAVKDV